MRWLIETDEPCHLDPRAMRRGAASAQGAPRVGGGNGDQQADPAGIAPAKRRRRETPMSPADVVEPRVDLRDLAAVDPEVIEPRAEPPPPLEHGDRHPLDALRSARGSSEACLRRHRRELVSELATGADELVHLREVLEHRRRRYGCPPGDVADGGTSDPLLVVELQRGLDDPTPSVGRALRSLSEPIRTPFHESTEHTVRRI
jgi:hypothetical protein